MGNPHITIIEKKSVHGKPSTSPFHFPLEHQPWGEPEQTHVQISLSQCAYQAVSRHIREGQPLEVGGLLLGKLYQASQGKMHLEILEALPDSHGRQSRTSFEFTHQSWSILVEQVEQKYPGLRIVGWYHSHPGLGVFYSDTDRKSHLTYFNKPWLAGLVVDPAKPAAGFYILSTLLDDVFPLPGFYERLDRSKESIINWRNWERKPAFDNIPKKEYPVLSTPNRVAKLARLSLILACFAWLWLLLSSFMGIYAVLNLQKKVEKLQSQITNISITLTNPLIRVTPLITLTIESNPVLVYPTNTPQFFLYIVKNGDTLSGIAAHFGVTSETLMELNQLTNDKINIGQNLKIPFVDGYHLMDIRRR